MGINVDYTPAGPSYINGTAAPSMINLSISLRETKLWWSDEWRKRATGISPFRSPETGAAGFEARGAGSPPTVSVTEIE